MTDEKSHRAEWKMSPVEYGQAQAALRKALSAQNIQISMATVYEVLDALKIVPGWASGDAVALPVVDPAVADDSLRERLLSFGWLPPGFDWLPMAEAPRDGTPVLVRLRVAEQLPNHMRDWSRIKVVLHNNGGGFGWRFAFPTLMIGFTDDQLDGWLHLPAESDS